jgi:hypothetical protein
MSGHRQAALALYRLGAPDQDLILAELPDADQARLRGYLAELAELGFDDTLPAPTPPRLFSLVARAPASPHEQVRAAPAAAIAALLADEPAGLVAQVLASEPWPWHGELLELLDPARRALVLGALEARRGQGAAPACATALVEAMAPRLAVHGMPASAPGVSRLLMRARAWTR